MHTFDRSPLNHYSLGIVDNDPLVLDLLARSFGTLNAPLHVRWAFTDPQQAWLACDDESTRPQVVLTDIEMPGMNGRELFHRLRASHPNVVVIGISAFPNSVEEPGLVVLPKESRIEEIVHLAGMLLHDESLIRWYEQPARTNPLSPSELQTLDHYAQGKTTPRIAHTMHVSESSVKTFVKSTCKKLGVHSHTEVTATGTPSSCCVPAHSTAHIADWPTGRSSVASPTAAMPPPTMPPARRS